MELPTLRGENVTLRALEVADLDALTAVIQDPSVAEWWGEAEEPERLSENLRNDGAAFVIEVDGEVRGWLGFTEETEPEYRSVGLDISLAPSHQGKGLGPDALRTVIRWFADERGHHRFTIDPNARNQRAIRAYEAVGFRPVGILRSYERGADGSWQDGLLMDLLADELS